CVPVCHLHDARHVNCAASGAPFNTSRASSSACKFTPLFAVVIVIVSPPLTLLTWSVRRSPESCIGRDSGRLRQRYDRAHDEANHGRPRASPTGESRGAHTGIGGDRLDSIR